MALVLSFILIFLYYLGSINFSGLVASLLTSIILIFLVGLGLKLISRRGIMELNLVFVLIGNFNLILLISIVLIFFDQ